MYLSKRGEMDGFSNVAKLILVAAVLAVIFFGIISYLRIGTDDLGDKSKDIADLLKATDIEQLMLIDRDDLTDDEKEKLAEDPNSDAKNRIENAKKFIEEENYDRALVILEDAKELTGIGPETLKLIDSLIDEVKSRKELRSLENRFDERETVEDLLPLKFEVDNFVVKSPEVTKEGALDLQGKIDEALLNEHGYELEETPRGKKYTDWLNGEKLYSETLTLAREFSGGDFDSRYVILYRYAAQLANNDGEEFIARKSLADSFYTDERFENAISEYTSIYGSTALRTEAENSDLTAKINELSKKGYSSAIQWDIKFTFSLLKENFWNDDFVEVVWPNGLSSYNSNPSTFNKGVIDGSSVHSYFFDDVGIASELRVNVPLNKYSWNPSLEDSADGICIGRAGCTIEPELRFIDGANGIICKADVTSEYVGKTPLTEGLEWKFACSNSELFGRSEYGVVNYPAELRLIGLSEGSESSEGEMVFEFVIGSEKGYPFMHERYEADLSMIS